MAVERVARVREERCSQFCRVVRRRREEEERVQLKGGRVLEGLDPQLECLAFSSTQHVCTRATLARLKIHSVACYKVREITRNGECRLSTSQLSGSPTSPLSLSTPPLHPLAAMPPATQATAEPLALVPGDALGPFRLGTHPPSARSSHPHRTPTHPSSSLAGSLLFNVLNRVRSFRATYPSAKVAWDDQVRSSTPSSRQA